MKRLFILLSFFTFIQCGYSQNNWSISMDQSKINWLDYTHVSFPIIGYKGPIIGLFVTAHAGWPGDNTGTEIGPPLPKSVKFSGSIFSFKPDSLHMGRFQEINDSNAVPISVIGINRENSKDYQFRVLFNGTKEIQPWSDITSFIESEDALNSKGQAFLGSFKTTWGNYIAVELKNRNETRAFDMVLIMWKERKPIVRAVFSNQNLTKLIGILESYESNDTIKGHLVDNLELPNTESSVILYISKTIFNKKALEYQVFKNGELIQDWKSNDFNKGLIWLSNLSPGTYKIKFRLTSQRHNVSEYQFKIATAWHQTAAFKITLGSLLAAFAGFIYLFFKNRRQQKKLQIKEQDLQSLLLKSENLKSQLNPHFVFNTLSSIQSLINKQDSTQANLFLNKFSKLLRSTLESNQVEFIPIEKEQAFIADYLFLQSIRYNFKFEIQCTPELLIVEIPPFITQPIIENALLHGFTENIQNPFLKVLFLQRGHDLLIAVEDNGKGFDPSLVQKNHGLSITYQRIELLNQLKNEQIASINIESEPGKGSIFSITLKNWIQG